MGRPVPTGNDANEWRLWLFENAAAGAERMAEQIAAAMGESAAASKLIQWDAATKERSPHQTLGLE